MVRLVLPIIALLALAPVATAQTVVTSPVNPGVNVTMPHVAVNLASPVAAPVVAGPPLRIQVTFQVLSAAAPALPPEEQPMKTEAMRRSLYEAATHECAILAEILKGDCRLILLNVSSNVQFVGNGQQTISTSANGSFEVTSQPASKAP